MYIFDGNLISNSKHFFVVTYYGGEFFLLFLYSESANEDSK